MIFPTIFLQIKCILFFFRHKEIIPLPWVHGIIHLTFHWIEHIGGFGINGCWIQSKQKAISANIPISRSTEEYKRSVIASCKLHSLNRFTYYWWYRRSFIWHGKLYFCTFLYKIVIYTRQCLISSVALINIKVFYIWFYKSQFMEVIEVWSDEWHTYMENNICKYHIMFTIIYNYYVFT